MFSTYDFGFWFSQNNLNKYMIMLWSQPQSFIFVKKLNEKQTFEENTKICIIIYNTQ